MSALRRRRALLRAFLDDHLRRHPCADCGTDDVGVLEFDHLGPKRGDIAALWRLGGSLDALKDEVAGCEVVCVNCHRHRTAQRAGWWRLDLDRPPPATWGPGRTRNLRWMYGRLAESGCVECGERDVVVLEFDHVGDKRAAVSDLAWNGYSLESLRREVAQCEVRCCNCHRRRTLERRADAA